MSRAAAAWLLDQIRPKPYIRPAIAAADEPMRQGHAYALTAVGNVLYEISTAPPGQRNDVAFRAGCRLIELARAPWACLDLAQVQAAFLRACETANVDGHFRDGEHWSIWLKAERKVTMPAVLPPAAHLGSVVAWDQMPPGVAAFGEAGQAPAWQIFDPDDTSAPPAPVVNPYDPFELAVAREAWNLRVREEAKRRLVAAAATPIDWAAALLTEEMLSQMPAPVPLVTGWLFCDSLARILGPSEGLKTFVAVDLAASVSTGQNWHGKAVRQGLSIIVAGEGAAGIKLRLAAWAKRRGLDRTGVLVLPFPVQSTGPEWVSFVAHLAELRPALVVLDTQARVTLGLKENEATDMGLAVDAWEALRAATGACVLPVHHMGVAQDRGRGSTAVYAALTSEITVRRSGMTLTLSCSKQKDAEHPSPMILTAVPEGESLVLVGAQEPDAMGIFEPLVTRDIGRERALQLVQVLRSNFALGNGGTRAEIKSLFVAVEGIRELPSGGQRMAWARAWGRLEDAGRIARNPIAERFRFVEIDDADDLAANPDALTEFGWPVAQKPAKAGAPDKLGVTGPRHRSQKGHSADL